MPVTGFRARAVAAWMVALPCIGMGGGFGPALAEPQAWQERDVALALGNATLRGTLVLPGGDARVPGVLLLAGSGATDRNGNSPAAYNDALRRLAHGLAEAGIASLRADKRGVGGSIPPGLREADLRFDDYIEDAVRWTEFLRAEPRIDATFIVGHSEGALIGILAAQRSPLDGVVSIAGPGVPIGTLLRQQFAGDSRWSPSLQAAAALTIHELEAGRTVANLPPELAGLFRPSVQPYLISQFRYDPAAEIAKLRGPILILQGDRDLQVSEADARRLAAAAPQADLAILYGMNHVLRDAPADRAGNAALYNLPERPLAAGLLPSLTAFLDGAGRRRP